MLTISSLSDFPLAVTPLALLLLFPVGEIGLIELCKFRNLFSVTFMAEDRVRASASFNKHGAENLSARFTVRLPASLFVYSHCNLSVTVRSLVGPFCYDTLYNDVVTLFTTPTVNECKLSSSYLQCKYRHKPALTAAHSGRHKCLFKEVGRYHSPFISGNTISAKSRWFVLTVDRDRRDYWEWITILSRLF